MIVFTSARTPRHDLAARGNVDGRGKDPVGFNGRGNLPELVAMMVSNLKAVTLEQLLSHTSSIPTDTVG